MKKLIELIKKLLGSSSSSSNSSSSSGFTLIELIIVIAILGILAAAVLAAIDPVDKIRSGNDSKVQGDVRQIYDAALRSYAQASVIPANRAAIVTAGELQSEPRPPAGYTLTNYGYAVNGVGDTATDVCVWSRVLSKAQIKKAQAAPFLLSGASQTNLWLIANNGKTCYATAQPTGCPASPTCP
ncbi:type II secretion system protein [Candidatus Curtissbacteria bacterium]|nr:type II secretion system protein [Candidatus Curtissbacteria bacterium]